MSEREDAEAGTGSSEFAAALEELEGAYARARRLVFDDPEYRPWRSTTAEQDAALEELARCEERVEAIRDHRLRGQQ